ncbi:MAG: pyrroloquinoline quinone biosynthesis protein PqqB [Polyangiales bacterium]
MRVIVLGSAAGGGLPQWNCGCPRCTAARTAPDRVRPRAQSSICVSADGERWVLFNASPDVRSQLAATPALWPRSLRHSPVRAVALTNADIDHAAGLLILREGGAPAIYCTARVEEALTEGLRVLPALAAYGRVVVRRVTCGEAQAVCDRDGEPTGVTVRAFPVTSKPPPYMVGRPAVEGELDTVGYVISAGDASVAYVPGVRVLDEALRKELAAVRCVFIDGTFLTDDELVAMGASAKTSKEMGHAPLRGDDGLVAFLDGVIGPRKVLVHINNSNPIHEEGAEARAWLAAHGVEVAHDGLTVDV